MQQSDAMLLKIMPDTPTEIVTPDMASAALRDATTQRAKGYRAAESTVKALESSEEHLSPQQEADLAAAKVLYDTMRADYSKAGEP